MGRGIRDRKSQGAHVVFLDPNMVFWSSYKQPTVSQSTTEAEYRSIAELEWIKMLLTELNVDILLWWSSGVTTSVGGAFKESDSPHSIKAFSMHFHFIKERVVGKVLDVRFVWSEDQIANLLMKALPRVPFDYLASKLTEELPINLRGCIE